MWPAPLHGPIFFKLSVLPQVQLARILHMLVLSCDLSHVIVSIDLSRNRSFSFPGLPSKRLFLYPPSPCRVLQHLPLCFVASFTTAGSNLPEYKLHSKQFRDHLQCFIIFSSPSLPLRRSAVSFNTSQIFSISASPITYCIHLIE